MQDSSGISPCFKNCVLQFTFCKGGGAVKAFGSSAGIFNRLWWKLEEEYSEKSSYTHADRVTQFDTSKLRRTSELGRDAAHARSLPGSFGQGGSDEW